MDLEGWNSTDTPVLVLNDRWLLATDLDQWVVYQRKGNRWRSTYYPTSTQSLLWYLKTEVPKTDPQALAKVRGWPLGHFNQWRTTTAPSKEPELV